MLVPGGRVHALGGGIVAFEIQQNSDTTYRIFDWHRTDSNGRSRELHVENALRCIDFSDFEPALIGNCGAQSGRRTLIDEGAFRIELGPVADLHEINTDGAFMILGSVSGDFTVGWGGGREAGNRLACNPGMFCLVPASTRAVRLHGDPTAKLLLIRPALPEGAPDRRRPGT